MAIIFKAVSPAHTEAIVVLSEAKIKRVKDSKRLLIHHFTQYNNYSNAEFV